MSFRTQSRPAFAGSLPVIGPRARRRRSLIEYNDSVSRKNNTIVVQSLNTAPRVVIIITTVYAVTGYADGDEVVHYYTSLYIRVYESSRYHINNNINNIQYRCYILGRISYESILYYNNYYSYDCITIPGRGAAFVIFYDNYLLRAWQANCT